MTGKDHEGYEVFEEILITRQDIINCSYSNWSKYFKSNLIPSKIIKPLPKSFLNYIKSDSIILPKDNRDENIVENSDNEYSDWESEDEDNNKVEINSVEEFKSLHEEIEENIKEFDNKVVVKLNWSAPKDAKWILINNLIKCESVNDVYLILKASDHIIHDLDYALEEIEEEKKNEVLKERVENEELEYELVIKKWIDINPALEFRIFIHDNKIIGTSQRDLNYYNYLEDLKPKISKIIESFWNGIKSDKNFKFENKNFIMDVYIPRPFKKLYLIDINPFSRKTDSLLYTWNELLLNKDEQNDGNDNMDIRLINENNLGRFAKKENSESQVPLEVIDAASNIESMIELAKKWNKLEVEDADDSDSNSD